MAVTWNARKNLALLTAAGDKIEWTLHPKYAKWYSVAATAGTTLLHIREPRGLAHLWGDVAEQVQFSKVILLPDVINGFEIDVMGDGYVELCLKGGTEDWE